MPHINTEPGGHDLTVSAYIIRLDKPEPSLLLHRHKKLGHWLQFGGHVDHGENPWGALTHELIEEAGYDMAQLQVLQPSIALKSLTGVISHPVAVSSLTHKFPGLDHWHTDLGFAFTADESPKHKIADGESDNIKLFTLDELNALPDGDIPENVREVARFVFGILDKWEPAPATDWPVNL